MKTREIFNYNIFKVNKNGLLLVNKYKLGIKVHTMRNN